MVFEQLQIVFGKLQMVFEMLQRVFEKFQVVFEIRCERQTMLSIRQYGKKGCIKHTLCNDDMCSKLKIK